MTPIPKTLPSWAAKINFDSMNYRWERGMTVTVKEAAFIASSSPEKIREAMYLNVPIAKRLIGGKGKRKCIPVANLKAWMGLK